MKKEKKEKKEGGKSCFNVAMIDKVRLVTT